jgi:phage terminase large subunit-like protein
MATEYKSKKIVHKYIDDVLNGTIPACKYLKLACQRHLDDLEHGHERGLYFDEEAGQEIIDFIQLLKHSKGKWAGQNLILEPWQQFTFWVAYGWMNADGTRRFRVVYKEVARKNGKSTEAASIGSYGLGFDGENGAEVYSIATKEEQARITFEEGQRMTRKSGNLGGMATVNKKSIVVEESGSCWKPLGKNSKTQDGLNVSLALVDEFHEHPDRSMIEVMDSAMGARSQPMMFIITTAGFNVQSPCYMERDYVIKVLEGTIEDDTYFGVIYTLDRDEVSGELLDDWKDPSVWVKANPNYGVSLYEADMIRMCNKAQNDPSAVNNFLTKRMNVWTTQVTRFFNMEKWNACTGRINEADLIGLPCFIGVDLASKQDITAVVCVFPFPDGRLVVAPKFYCPREGAEARSRKDRVPYLRWEELGYLTLTEGNVTDYDVIKSDIERCWEMYDVQKMGFDQWNFDYLLQRLVSDGMNPKKIIQYGQTIKNMSEPTKELSALVNSGKLVHNANPVLKWMASNAAVYTDPNENVRPVKDKSSEKIDGIVATVMGLGLSMVEPEAVTSIYETSGLRHVG